VTVAAAECSEAGRYAPASPETSATKAAWPLMKRGNGTLIDEVKRTLGDKQ
jgi:hypothetical protein